MTTQTELKPEQLPYANETALVNKLMALTGKFFTRLGNLLDTLSNAIEMRNRYVALDSLDVNAAQDMFDVVSGGTVAV